ncbi:MAG: hypothetical protein AVDCRST_MAG89-4797, partial [uncultured Gemmatimonadetes bacterium]
WRSRSWRSGSAGWTTAGRARARRGSWPTWCGR